MNVLVTGANGYLGRSLCPFLLGKGHSVTTLTRTPWELSGTTNMIVTWQEKEALRDCVDGQEVVVHLAALAHQPGRENEAMKSRYWSVNVNQTELLAQAALSAGVKRFIYISSIKVNGEATITSPYRFDSHPAPEDLYGRSKWAAEELLRKLFAGTATELVIIRPPLIWGGVMKGNLALLQALVRWGAPLPFGAVHNRRDLVSLHNLCSLISVVVSHPKAAGQTLLVSDGISRTTAEIIRLVSAGVGKRANIISCPSSILELLAVMPFIGGKLKKLTGNLEVDISPTCELLAWQPDKQQV